MDEDCLKITQTGVVTTLRMNRPNVLNAIHPPLHHALQAAFDAFAVDESQRICILTGTGARAFSVGSDLKFVAGKRAAGGADVLTPLPANGYGGLSARFDLAKPVIAVVNGLALGGGFELALACDLIIASDHARFGLPEVKVGGLAHAGGAARLARQIPLKRAMAMLLTGDLIDAQEGLALGLVNQVVPSDGLEAAARDWCARLLEGAPKSAALTKQAVLRGLDAPSLEIALERQASYPEFAAWLAADEVTEGAAAFTAKRPPRWANASGHDDQ